MKRLLPGVSVVSPVYNSKNTLQQLNERIHATLNGVTEFEIILIDDGSSDESWQFIQKLASSNTRVHGLRLNRNYGQHNATLAGIRSAMHELTVTIDDDLQFAPEDIPKLLNEFAKQDCDVVYGVPAEVNHGSFRKFSSKLLRKTLSKTINLNRSSDLSPFRLFRTNLREAFSNPVGPNVSIDALLAWGSSRFSTVAVSHSERKHGSSNYNVVKLVKHALDIITSYSTRPLQWASVLGIVVAFFGLGLFIWVVVSSVFNETPVPGFATLAGSIAIFSGIQLICVGIIGEYLSRMHFRVMNKPSYSVGDEV